MNALSPVLAETAAASATRCVHCGGALAPGQARFCCHGCEGAFALVNRLGLDGFYRRRAAADGTLRPEVEASPVEYAALAVPAGEGAYRLELMVAGLTCGACVWLVEQALAQEPDVTRARLNFSDRRLSVAWNGPAARADALAALVARLGFRVAPWSPACLRATEDAEGRALVRALGIAAFGAVNVMMLSVAVWVGADMGEATRAALHWVAALIGLPVILVAGMPFYRSAVAGLRAGRVSMDLAISLGVLATAAMSLSETVQNGRFTWFDGATMLLAVLLAGRVLDRAARRRVRQAAAELLALREGSVTRIAPDGTAQAIPMEQARAGDVLLVAAGERLRLDGMAAEAVLLDTAAITGESLPRGIPAGEALPAGAVNMGAPFRLTVSAAAADGSLAAMARLLEQAEAAKGRYHALADRAARLYLPIAHLVAAATFLGWWLWAGLPWPAALVPAVAVLLITCPCGLAIAVPAVQAVAVGALFRRGVLVSSPTALERLAEADHAVLDKTGTLTEGRPRWIADPAIPAGVSARAAALARASRHPLARALAAAVPGGTVAEGVVEHPGQGLAAGERRLGSPDFCGVAGDGQGMTLVYREGDGPAWTFRFADRLREDAAVSVAALRHLGLTVELLSGDGEAAVREAAAACGIDAWTANAGPEAKRARLAALRAEGRRPLMLGDGINDAMALAEAHVSASPADATDIAQSAADLVLRTEGLAALPHAVALSRRARRIARQSLGFSLAYNLVAVPVAILGLATPLIAALIMASSSILVVLNALRVGRAP
ncbi:heavy metal translocating P-type ATPase [Roseomonas sp. OT10]|uniref:heavy metal translocating P-type ATPase n=1 Tax=Roseomonas cutis TaxID=2897332 RepID=UPI001E60DEE6|nr:heavy metal translocating P-type ATPase [Roseomonas sp. OT10]UFN48633.1 heavy metal translocating P-type ATPase [Roseomonas sp. OT10]